MTLLAEVWAANPKVVSMEEKSILYTYHVPAWVRERCPLCLGPSRPETGGRAVTEVLRTGEPSLLIINCSTWESGRYTLLPGQHSRADPEGVGVGEPTLKMRKQESPIRTHN